MGVYTCINILCRIRNILIWAFVLLITHNLLIDFVSGELARADIKYSLNTKGHIYIYSFGGIKHYFEVFGSNNPKHTEKLAKHERVFFGGVR